MIYTIENNQISVSINSFGAELYSYKSKETGTEYLWQGDENVWSGRSPILFPIVGTLLDNEYKVDGVTYHLNRHGFAKANEFEVIEKSDNSITFSLKYSDETLKIFPYKFELQIEFMIDEKALSVTHRVLNKDDKTIYFSIGAHPGFNCEIGDYLEFEQNETISAEKINEKAVLLEEKFPVLDNEKNIIVTKDIFDADALILSDYKSNYLTLKSRNHSREVKFIFDSPYLGIWAKPGANYVCLEPWFGINDPQHETDDFSNKRAIEKLEADETFSFSWTAVITH